MKTRPHFVLIERGSPWRYAVYRCSPTDATRLPHVTGHAATWVSAWLKAHLHAWWAGRHQ